MKLVITYDVGDGCTYGYEVNECVEYESAEAFICDLEKWVKENKDSEPSPYAGSGFLGTNIQPDNSQGQFLVRTLDQWFDNNVVNLKGISK